MTAKKAIKEKVGRKWFDGKDEKGVLAKLEEVTALDASVEECLYWADITKDSYYRYLASHPEFREKLAKMRERPILLARQTAVRRMTESYSNAMDYLSRKRKAEFASRQEVTGADGEALFDNETKEKSKKAIGEFLRRNTGKGK